MLQTMTCLPKFFSGILTSWQHLIVATCLLTHISAEKAYCFDTVSFKQFSAQGIPVSSKVDLTKLPLGETFTVVHSKFTLEFFFNNRDIFGFIAKRKANFGIIVHLCFFRSCEESPLDFNKVIAMPQDPPSNQTFFSIKFPQGLQYEFQGMEFLPVN